MNTLILDIHAVPFRMPNHIADIRLFDTDVNQYTQAELAKLTELLSVEERDKVNRYHKKNDKLLSVIARANLRRLLGVQLGHLPQTLTIKNTAYGKPFLNQPTSNIDFNVSHAGSKVVIALDCASVTPSSNQSYIGIDIERINPQIDIQVIAKYYFSERELYLINQSPEPVTTFFIYWTRKEALLKAAGVGLINELPQIDVARSQTIVIPSGLPTALLGGTFDLWTFINIQGYIVSLAVKRLDRHADLDPFSVEATAVCE